MLIGCIHLLHRSTVQGVVCTVEVFVTGCLFVFRDRQLRGVTERGGGVGVGVSVRWVFAIMPIHRV